MIALAFRAHPAVTKALLVADMRAHREADRLVPGIYWHNRRGCAVGCSIHTINRVTRRRIKHGDHTKLAAMTGIPEQLLHLQDRLFESLPSERRALWPEQFYAAIPDGADLSDVWPRFAVWLLCDLVLPTATGDERVAAVINRVITGYETGWTNDTAHDAAAYARAAASAYDAAAYACAAASYAAYACACAYNAAYAASAASASPYAAKVSPYVAAAEQMADKLLQLLAEAPVPAAETPA